VYDTKRPPTRRPSMDALEWVMLLALGIVATFVALGMAY
jgi:hypothetical protein